MNAFLSLLQKLLIGSFLLIVGILAISGLLRKLSPGKAHDATMPWPQVKNENTADAYIEYLRECSSCTHADEAEKALDLLQRSQGLVARLDREHLSVREDLVATTFSPEGQTIIAAGANRIHFWDADTGKQQPHASPDAFHFENRQRITSLRYSLGGKQIAAGTANKGGGNLMVWDTKSGELIGNHTIEGYDIKAVAFAPKGVGLGWLADGPVGIWEPQTDKIMRATHEGATALSFVRDETDQLWLITAAEREVWLWEPSTMEPMQKHELKTEKALLGISRDGKTILYHDRHGLEIWNPVTGELVANLGQFDSELTAFCRDPRKGWMVLGTKSGILYLWDISQVKLLGQITAHRDAIDELACSINQKVVSKGVDSTKIWNLEKLKNAYSRQKE